MSASNKLIEAIAENFTEAMTDILRNASEYGDTETIEAVAEVLRDDGYIVFRNDAPIAGCTETIELADLLEAARLSTESLAAKGNLEMCRNAVLDDIDRLRFTVEQGKVPA